jgi:hypothetical protein
MMSIPLFLFAGALARFAGLRGINGCLTADALR